MAKLATTSIRVKVNFGQEKLVKAEFTVCQMNFLCKSVNQFCLIKSIKIAMAVCETNILSLSVNLS